MGGTGCAMTQPSVRDTPVSSSNQAHNRRRGRIRLRMWNVEYGMSNVECGMSYKGGTPASDIRHSTFLSYAIGNGLARISTTPFLTLTGYLVNGRGGGPEAGRPSL